MLTLDPCLLAKVRTHPHPLLFATISGAHLYGFPSPDSDFDLPDADLTFHHREYLRLTHQLHSAHESSTLPDSPSARPALDDLLVRIRQSQNSPYPPPTNLKPRSNKIVTASCRNLTSTVQ